MTKLSDYIKISETVLISLVIIVTQNLVAMDDYNITGSVGVPSGAIADSLEARLLDTSGNVVASVPVVNNQFDFSSTAVDNDISIPLDYKLSHNFPNPFNPSTRLSFEMKKQGDVKVEIFDVLGRLVDHSEGQFAAGNYTINWSPNNRAAGNYFAKVTLGNLVFAEKMQLSDGSGYGTGISIDGGGQNIPDGQFVRPMGLKKAMNEELRIQLVSKDGKYYNRTENVSFSYDGSSVNLGELKTFEVHTVPGTSVDFLDYCKAVRTSVSVRTAEYPFKIFLDEENAMSSDHVDELKRRIDRKNTMIANYRPGFQMYTYDGVTENPEVGIAVSNGTTQSIDHSRIDAYLPDGRVKHGTVQLPDISQLTGYPSYGWGLGHGLQHAVYGAGHPDDEIPEIKPFTVMGTAPEHTELDARFDAVNSYLDHRTEWDIFTNPND